MPLYDILFYYPQNPGGTKHVVTVYNTQMQCQCTVYVEVMQPSQRFPL